MAVTVKISDPFYSPSGVCKSFIAKIVDDTLPEDLTTTLLHSYVARTVGQRIRTDGYGELSCSSFVINCALYVLAYGFFSCASCL